MSLRLYHMHWSQLIDLQIYVLISKLVAKYSKCLSVPHPPNVIHRILCSQAPQIITNRIISARFRGSIALDDAIWKGYMRGMLYVTNVGSLLAMEMYIWDLKDSIPCSRLHWYLQKLITRAWGAWQLSFCDDKQTWIMLLLGLEETVKALIQHTNIPIVFIQKADR